jgi:hypothetical protein
MEDSFFWEHTAGRVQDCEFARATSVAVGGIPFQYPSCAMTKTTLSCKDGSERCA